MSCAIDKRDWCRVARLVPAALFSFAFLFLVVSFYLLSAQALENVPFPSTSSTSASLITPTTLMDVSFSFIQELHTAFCFIPTCLVGVDERQEGQEWPGI